MAAFDSAAFRAQFQEFASLTAYPDATLSAYWDMGTNYIQSTDSAIMTGNAVQLALDLMCAHLAKSFSLLNQGVTTVVVSGSSEGSVSVSMVPPPVKTGWQWWLSTTGYGQQLRALLSAQAPAGYFVGGGLERNSFRKAGGVW